MLILVGLLVAVVIGWVVLGPRLLPSVEPSPIDSRAPEAAAASPGRVDGQWTTTPDSPDRTTLQVRDGAYVLEGRLAYRGSGSLAATESELTFADDPACPGVKGRYSLSLGETERYGLLPQYRAQTMTLTLLDDACADGLRARALTASRWVLRASQRDGIYGVCDPPNAEAAITGHWPEPTGCSGP